MHRQRRIHFVLALVLAAPVLAANDLEHYVDNIRRALPPSVALGVSVEDVRTGQVIVGHHSDRSLVPASVVKIFTSYAVLKKLGPSYRIPTEIFADHLPWEGHEAGDIGTLYLRGHGDPALVIENLWLIVQELMQRGVKRVAKVVVDDSLFIEPRGALGTEPYQAALSAASFNFNSLAVAVAPTGPGHRPLVTLTPGIELSLENLARTGAQNSLAVVPARGDVLNGLRVSGEIGGTMKTFYFAVPSPPRYLGGALKRLMEDHGVVVGERVGIGSTPPSAKLLMTWYSKETAEILRDLNRYSNNFIAGQLLFQLGRQPDGRYSAAEGLAEVRRSLAELGISGNRFRMVDAAGLDRGNRATTRQLTIVLGALYRDLSLAPDFISSLSRFGASGTLKTRRLVAANSNGVWGKTGSLDGVSALAGYCEGQSGRRYAFAILLNGDKAKEQFSRVEEEIVQHLTEQ